MANNSTTAIPGSAIPGYSLPGTHVQYLSPSSISSSESFPLNSTLSFEVINTSLGLQEVISSNASVFFAISQVEITSSDIVGNITLECDISTNSIPISASVPSPLLGNLYDLNNSIQSQELFPSYTIEYAVTPPSISQSNVPNPTFIADVTLSSGITSQESVYANSVIGQGASLDSIPISYSIPQSGLQVTYQPVVGTSIVDESFGSFLVYYDVISETIISSESFGITNVPQIATLHDSVPTQRNIINPVIETVIDCTSFGSDAVISPSIASLYVGFGGIVSSSSFGTPSLKYNIQTESIVDQSLVPIPDSITYQTFNVGNITDFVINQPNVTGTNIDTSIMRFDYALWKSIHDKELYCYNTSAGETAYQPFFTALGNALAIWVKKDRTKEVRNLINSVYAYHMFDVMYKTDNSLETSLKASNIFNITATDPSTNSVVSYITKVESKPVSYYADYIPPSSTTSSSGTTTTTPAQAPNLQNDTQLVQAAYAYETSNINSLENQMQDTTGNQLFTLLFNDVTTQGTLSKHDMGVYVFKTLGYYDYFKTLNINLQIPTYLNI